MTASESTDLRCPACRYDLTGVRTEGQPTGHCPECGAAFDLAKLVASKPATGRLGALTLSLLLPGAGAPLIWTLAIAATEADLRLTGDRLAWAGLACLVIGALWNICLGCRLAFEDFCNRRSTRPARHEPPPGPILMAVGYSLALLLLQTFLTLGISIFLLSLLVAGRVLDF